MVTTDTGISISANNYYNVTCQFSDIGSHNQLSNEQKWCISKQTRLREIFHKEKYLSLEKVIPMAKFANHYKTIF